MYAIVRHLKIWHLKARSRQMLQHNSNGVFLIDAVRRHNCQPNATTDDITNPWLTAANNLNIAVLVSSTTRVNVSDDCNQWLILDSSWQIQQSQVIEWVEHKGGKQEVDIALDEQPIQSCQNRCDVLMSTSLLDPPASSHSLLTRTIKQVVDVARVAVLQVTGDEEVLLWHPLIVIAQ